MAMFAKQQKEQEKKGKKEKKESKKEMYSLPECPSMARRMLAEDSG